MFKIKSEPRKSKSKSNTITFDLKDLTHKFHATKSNNNVTTQNMMYQMVEYCLNNIDNEKTENKEQ